MKMREFLNEFSEKSEALKQGISDSFLETDTSTILWLIFAAFAGFFFYIRYYSDGPSEFSDY